MIITGELKFIDVSVTEKQKKKDSTDNNVRVRRSEKNKKENNGGVK